MGYVEFMNNAASKIRVTVDCWKCWGVKEFSCWKHIEGGACFTCGGVGTVDVSVDRVAWVESRRVACGIKTAEMAERVMADLRGVFRELRAELANPGTSVEQAAEAREWARGCVEHLAQHLSAEQLSKVRAGFATLGV